MCEIKDFNDGLARVVGDNPPSADHLRKPSQPTGDQGPFAIVPRTPGRPGDAFRGVFAPPQPEVVHDPDQAIIRRHLQTIESELGKVIGLISCCSSCPMKGRS